MTLQEMFDKIVTGLWKQGGKCFSNGSCLYRHESEYGEVSRCAMGMLIPDDVYDEEMEDNSASDILAEFPKLANAVLGHTYDCFDDQTTARFLDDAQTIHDDAGLSHWEQEFRDLADKFELEATVIDKVPWNEH